MVTISSGGTWPKSLMKQEKKSFESSNGNRKIVVRLPDINIILHV